MPEYTSKNSWHKYRFDEMAVMVNNRIDDPSEADVEYYVGLEHLDSESLTIRRWGSPSDVEATKLRFRAGDIIFGRRRVYQRKLAVAHFDGICSAHAMVLRAKPEVALQEFLPYFMQSDLFMERAKEISVGSLSPTINWKTLAEEEFSLPPLEEQWRIVAACEASRRTSEAYRNLFIKASALLGACVDALADEFAGSFQSIGALVDKKILAEPQDGNHGEKHPTARDYVAEGIPFLMAADIRNGRVDLLGCHFISRAVSEGLRIGFALEGDVLLTHKGTVGQSAVLKGLRTDYAMLTPQVTYYRVMDKNKLFPQYLYYAFQAANFQRQMVSQGRQSTRTYVGITKQRTLTLPIPPVSIQENVVERCRAIEATAQETNRRMDEVNRMLRMIVSKSFIDSER